MLRIKQIRGMAKIPKRQVETLRCLGLNKVGAEVELTKSGSVVGMLKKVSHLVSWEELNGKKPAESKKGE